MKTAENKPFVSTRNACKLCTPLGASLVFKGIEGCVPLIHGSQGCATYIRRYLISHYKEPVDIASTNFTEESAIFGGEANLFKALDNVSRQYKPRLIGIATTCLSETIGDDMQKLITSYESIHKDDDSLPGLVHVSTPSFRGTHASGFHNTVLSVVRQFARSGNTRHAVNLLPGFVSPADLRHLKEIVSDFGIHLSLLPDYSDTLDYGYTGEYETLPQGGTPLDEIAASGAAKATIEFGYILNRSAGKSLTAGEYLEKEFGVPCIPLGLPIGIEACDAFFATLEKISGCSIPETYRKQRARLIDAYIDGHKYVFEKKAVVYGEEDFVLAMTAFLEEIGIQTVLCASGGQSGLLKTVVRERITSRNPVEVHDNFDFEDIAQACRRLKPDLLIGNSKAYYIARELGIPLVRTGFPIHDRLGGQRILHTGYEGSLRLFDTIANTLIQTTQDNSPVGYKYM